MTFIKGLPLMLLTISLGCNAAVQPDRTRIVFNANDKATSLRIENQSDKLPYLAYSPIENEKGRKAMLFWSLCPYSTSGTESDIAGAGCETSLNHTITAIAKRYFSTICAKFLPLRIKAATMRYFRSLFKVVLNCSGDRLHYARKQEKRSNCSYRSASRATN